MSNRSVDTLVGLGIAFAVTVVVTIVTILLPELCVRLMTAAALLALCLTIISHIGRQQG